MHLALATPTPLPCQRVISHPADRAVPLLHTPAAAAAHAVTPCAAIAAPAAASAPPPPASAIAAASAPAAAAASAPVTARRAVSAHHLSRAVQREHRLCVHLRHPLRHRLKRSPRRLHVHEDPVATTASLLCVRLSTPASAPTARSLRRLALLHVHVFPQLQPRPRRHLDRRPAPRRLRHRQSCARLAPHHVTPVVHHQPLARRVGALLPAPHPALLAHPAPLHPALLASEARYIPLHAKHDVRPACRLRAVGQPQVALAHRLARRCALVACRLT